jgi:hypothetical protein
MGLLKRLKKAYLPFSTVFLPPNCSRGTGMVFAWIFDMLGFTYIPNYERALISSVPLS